MTVPTGGHRPDRAPVGTPGSVTDPARTRYQSPVSIRILETKRIEVHGGRVRPAKSAGFRGPKDNRTRAEAAQQPRFDGAGGGAAANSVRAESSHPEW